MSIVYFYGNLGVINFGRMADAAEQEKLLQSKSSSTSFRSRDLRVPQVSMGPARYTSCAMLLHDHLSFSNDSIVANNTYHR